MLCQTRNENGWSYLSIISNPVKCVHQNDITILRVSMHEYLQTCSIHQKDFQFYFRPGYMYVITLLH